MDDWSLLVKAASDKAYKLANERGRLPEQIKVEADFTLDSSGRMRFGVSQRVSDHRPTARIEFALKPIKVPKGMNILTDCMFQESMQGRKKKTRAQVTKAVLYHRHGGYCAGCERYFENRNMTVDHIIARSKGGTEALSNLQLLCHACNQLKDDHSQEWFLARLQELGLVKHE